LLPLERFVSKNIARPIFAIDAVLTGVLSAELPESPDPPPHPVSMSAVNEKILTILPRIKIRPALIKLGVRFHKSRLSATINLDLDQAWPPAQQGNLSICEGDHTLMRVRAKPQCLWEASVRSCNACPAKGTNQNRVSYEQ
jgi:hypothetical protein